VTQKVIKVTSTVVGFHVRNEGETGQDCGQPVTWYDSPGLSWLECACGSSSALGARVSYGKPVPVEAPQGAAP
jgi:hypothetical protein